MNSISIPLTPEESEQAARMKQVSSGDLAVQRSSIHGGGL
jgi:hypothetical protein